MPLFMALYFYLLSSTRFEAMCTTLARCVRERSFAPCRTLCREMAPATDAFHARYHISAEECMIRHVAEGLAFDRDRWRCLVGEMLMVAADEIPQIETAPDALACLVDGARRPESQPPRHQLSPIEQAHYGTQDLALGAAYYRPEHAGLNDASDVRRLADFLAALRPETWRAEHLAPLAHLVADEDRAEELAFVRDWFPALLEMYQRASGCGQVVVCEVLNS